MYTDLGLEAVELPVMDLNLADNFESTNLLPDTKLAHEQLICLHVRRASDFQISDCMRSRGPGLGNGTSTATERMGSNVTKCGMKMAKEESEGSARH